MGKVIRPFCWHKNFVPWGLSIPAPGLYTCIKAWKKLYKIRLQRHFVWTLQQMNEVTRHFCWNQNFVPWGLSAPAPGLYTCIKSWKKNCIKSDFKEIFLKLATNDRSDKMFLLTSKFHHQGVVSPCLGAIYVYKFMKKIIWNQTAKRFFLELVANDQNDKRFLLTSKFCPLGLSTPDLQLYTFIKSWKDVYKVRGWRDSF